MGNELGKLVAKHEAHIPVLNEDLAIPYALPTGGVFIPMSPITGDLPIYSIPQIILNAGMDSKDYQDCIYEINETSISRYSNVRDTIERLKYNLAPFDLYYQCIENLIIDVEDKCFELNNKILKKYNLVFLPFMDILRDETNTQHFGIIIDMLNRNKIEKKMNKIRKQNIRKITKNNKTNNKTNNNNNNNSKKTKNNKNVSKKEKEENKDCDVVKPSLFGCFKFMNHKKIFSKSKRVISQSSRTDGHGSESSDCTKTDNNNNNNNNNSEEASSDASLTQSGVCMGLPISMPMPSPCSMTNSKTNSNNNSNCDSKNEMMACECEEYIDESGNIEINNEMERERESQRENKVSYVESNATKFSLHIYLPKHLRYDA